MQGYVWDDMMRWGMECGCEPKQIQKFGSTAARGSSRAFTVVKFTREKAGLLEEVDRKAIDVSYCSWMVASVRLVH